MVGISGYPSLPPLFARWPWCQDQCFFFRLITGQPLEKVTVERFLKFQVPLTSSWDRFRRKIPGKKRKFRRAARAGHNRRGGKTRGKVFWFSYRRTKGPTGGVFAQTCVFTEIFKNTCWFALQNVTVEKSKSGPGGNSWRKKNTGLESESLQGVEASIGYGWDGGYEWGK